MRFSIIVPVYNVQKYLPDCLDSILGQSYKDYEVIIVDDGTLDCCGELADSYAAKHPQTIKVIHQNNMGLGGARNTGIAAASGEYLLFVDSDDFVFSGMLETLDAYLSKYQDDILCFGMCYITEKGEQIASKRLKTSGYQSISREEFIEGKPTVWDKVYKASLFKVHNMAFPLKMEHEDLAVIPAMALYAENIGKLDQIMYGYRLRKNSIMHKINTRQFFDLCRALECIYQYYEKEKKYEEFYAELEWLTVRQIIFFEMPRLLEKSCDFKYLKLAEDFLLMRFKNYRNNPYLKRNASSLSRNNKLLMAGRYRTVYCRLQIKKAIKNVFRQDGIAALKKIIYRTM